MAVIHPDGAVAQVEGGIVFGLSAALKNDVTLDRGRGLQRNFHDYEVLRMHEAPKTEVHVLPSTEHLMGIGEPPVAPAAPAVTNAVFAGQTGPQVANPDERGCVKVVIRHRRSIRNTLRTG